MKRNPKDTMFVGIQFILFLFYLFRISKIDFSIPLWLQYVGMFFWIAGIITALVALINLNRNLSPYPSPLTNAVLIKTGIYKYIRHPIYSGILFFTLGFSLYSENTLRLVIFILLLILFRLKAAYEERLLKNKFSNYEEYKKTTGMFLPKKF